MTPVVHGGFVLSGLRLFYVLFSGTILEYLLF